MIFMARMDANKVIKGLVVCKSSLKKEDKGRLGFSLVVVCWQFWEFEVVVWPGVTCCCLLQLKRAADNSSEEEKRWVNFSPEKMEKEMG